jgi:hypothetical protein
MYCGGSYIVILNIFISYTCLAHYGASEAIYLCNVVEKIHQYFRPKMVDTFKNTLNVLIACVSSKKLQTLTK